MPEENVDKVEALLVEGEHAVFLAELTRTAKSTGRRYQMPVATRLQVVGDKITKLYLYEDTAKVAQATVGTPARGCLSTRTATDTRAGTEPIGAALRGMLDGLEGVLALRLSQGDAAGRLTVPPVDAARVLVTATRGNVVVESVYEDPERLRAAARTLVDMLVRAA